MAQAGWYPDARDPELRHYFDGKAWSEPEATISGVGRLGTSDDDDLGPGLLGDPAHAALARPRRRRVAPALVAVVVTLVVAGIVTWVLWPESDRSVAERPAPPPPAAGRDVITAATLPASVRPRAVSARLVGRDVTAVIGAITPIDSYGTGAAARSAPRGQRLVAFTIGYGAGALTGSRTTTARAQLVSTDSDPRAIPRVADGQFVVAAIPAQGDAYVALTDGNLTQSIALPSGEPGDVVAVTQRKNTSVTLNARTTVGLDVVDGTSHETPTASVSASAATLRFWLAGAATARPSDIADAYLRVDLSYRFSASGPAMAFKPAQLVLLANGRTYPARQAPGATDTRAVFLVPADFTQGTVLISGTAREGSVVSRVTKPGRISIAIPAN